MPLAIGHHAAHFRDRQPRPRRSRLIIDTAVQHTTLVSGLALPAALSFSSTSTCTPGCRSRSWRAVASPTIPPPTMATFSRDSPQHSILSRSRWYSMRGQGSNDKNFPGPVPYLVPLSFCGQGGTPWSPRLLSFTFVSYGEHLRGRTRHDANSSTPRSRLLLNSAPTASWCYRDDFTFANVRTAAEAIAGVDRWRWLPRRCARWRR